MVRTQKAHGEPIRLEIFRLIAAQEEPRCCQIVARMVRMPLQQPTISHHLRQLREAELVTVSRRGIWAYYAVDRQGASAAYDLLGDVPGHAMEGAGLG